MRRRLARTLSSVARGSTNHGEIVDLRWSDNARRFVAKNYNEGKNLDPFAGLERETEVHWIRIFRQALSTDDGVTRAESILKKLGSGKTVGADILEASYAALLAHTTEVVQLKRLVKGFSNYGLARAPSWAAAFVLHECCRLSDHESISEIWKWWVDNGGTAQELYRNSAILSVSDKIVIQNTLGFLNVKSIATEPNTTVEHSSTLQLIRKRLDTEALFGTATENYMELYDSLSSDQKLKFDRAYDELNQVRQRQIELQAFSKAPKGPSTDESSLKELSWDWAQQLEDALKEYRWGGNSELSKFAELFNAVGYEAVSKIAASEMANLCIHYLNTESRGLAHVSNVAARLGATLEDAFRKSRVANPRRSRTTPEQGADAARVQMQRKLEGKYWLYSMEKMSQIDLIRVGASLLALCLKVLRSRVVNPVTGEEEMKPAFWHTFMFKEGVRVGVVKPNEFVIDSMVVNTEQDDLLSISDKLPMLIKPLPWVNYDEGGYAYTTLPLLSSSQGSWEQEQYIREAMKRGNMDEFLMALDNISSTAWAVNKRVLDVLESLLETKAAILDIPRLPTEEIPALDKSMHYKEKKRLLRLKTLLISKRSERLVYERMVEYYKAFAANGERFYFTYQIDFRGRAYPVSSVGMTPLGQESCRGLLQFWHGKRLGQDGLKWLKIHLANMYGADKISNEQREAFADAHTEQIIASANAPLQSRWWMGADKPFQTLAACFELRDALQMDNAEDYISRIPVNQDGSCNGLQHYAALGGDVEGALQVNMIPAATPNDVYSKVKDEVTKLASIDAQDGNPVALGLQGKITRKVVKQPVMTTVYGVTRFGAVSQVHDQLESLDLDTRHGVSLHQYSQYVSNKIFEVRRKMFRGAENIQSWLEESTNRICNSIMYSPLAKKPLQRNSVSIWTTPMGLPVVQAYREPEIMILATDIQKLRLRNPYKHSPVDIMRQRNGIAPNFIHSLDSTHMFRTAQSAFDHGLTFAAVHDSFWTHASSVPTLNKLLREEFIKLHENLQLVSNLRTEFATRSAAIGQLQLVYIPRASSLAEQILALRKKRGYKSVDEALADELRIEHTALGHHLNSGLHANGWTSRNKSRSSAVTPTVMFQQVNNSSGTGSGDSGRPPVYFFGSASNFLKSRTSELESKDSEPQDDGDTTRFFDYFTGDELPPIGSRKVPLWVPVHFPQIPKTGDYDVNMVRESEYFFS